jgi:hypothetical protein
LPDGVPAHVLAAFQANASDDPVEVEAAKQWLRERNGADYRFDPETKLFERLPAVVHAPPRRENAAPATRRREHKPTARRRARASDQRRSFTAETAARVIPHATFARVLRNSLGDAA